jgi:hypothetical protein
MGGMTVNNVTSKVVMLGDNNFQSGKITLAAGAALPAGAVLKRSGSDTSTFAAAASADEYAAVNPFEIKNETGAEKVFGFRPVMDGRVRQDMVKVSGADLTAADIDKLRKVGILPVKVTDLSVKDNQ